MIEMSNVFNAQLAEKALFVLFLLLFVLKKEKDKCMGNKRKILNTSTCSKKKKKIGTPFDIVVFPYNQRNSDINSPCLHIAF